MHDDVLIVGAGPAGSYLGYLLARQGLRVRLLDKADFPREKVCGGGLSHKTITFLPWDLSAVVSRRIRGALLTYGNRDTVVKDLGERAGAVTVRAVFDDFLRRQAIDAGVRFSGRTAFRRLTAGPDGASVETSRGTFRARFVAGADGVFSEVRRAVFGRDTVAYVPAVEALVEAGPDAVERFGDRVLFDFGAVPRGYGWIFPKEDHLNVGVFSPYPRRSIKGDLEAFMALYGALRSPRRVRHLGFSIPVRNRAAAFERGPVLLVGDAGGFAESFYGEGIYYALRSARCAADAIVASLAHSGEAHYTRLIRRELLPDLRYAALNARIFYPRQRVGFYRLARNPRVSGYFAEVIAGGLTPRACFFRTLATAPIWLGARDAAEGSGGPL